MGARALAAYDLRAGTGGSRTWDEVVDLLAEAAPTGISVDVYDTVLSRRLVGDSSTWWAVGTLLVRDGAWPDSVDAFVRARRVAAEARPNGTLDDICAEPVLGDRCPASTSAFVEHAVERSLTVPVAGAREALGRLREAGHRLTFVSDMHLSRAHLEDCLRHHGLAAPQDDLVISSEMRAAKWDGTLFPLLVRRTIPAIAWHVGNDLWSDVAMAERAGIRALPVRRAEATVLERTMAAQPGSVGGAIAGAALRVRSGAPVSAPEWAALQEVGADVAGQCLSAFLLWVREQCERLDVRQLLFLARDGELPFRMARAMPGDHWDGLSLTYLHGNRRLWSVAAAAVLGVDEWLAAGLADDAAFLRQGEHTLPWASLLGRVGLTPEDCTGLSDEPQPGAQAAAWAALLQDPGIRQLIAARAQRQCEDLRQHLTDEGVGRGRVAVVDVGWRGQLAWHVSSVLRAVTGDEPVHLHFGGVDIADESSHVDIRRFAVDDSREPLPFPDFISCVETITASGRPRARALERGPEGDVRLVFDSALPEMDTEHRRSMWRSAVDVAGALPPRATLREWGLGVDGLDRLVRAVLSEFWLAPTTVHATAAAHLSAEVDDAGAGVHPVARPYAVSPRRDQRRTWRQGSLALTTPLLRAPLELAMRARGAVLSRRSRPMLLGVTGTKARART